jgi:hypothetical protein
LDGRVLYPGILLNTYLAYKAHSGGAGIEPYLSAIFNGFIGVPSHVELSAAQSATGNVFIDQWLAADIAYIAHLQLAPFYY